MAKRSRSAHKRTSAKRPSSEKFSFSDLLTKKHRPFQAAGIGALMAFLPGILAAVGILIVVSSALVYGFRAFKSATR